jgi:hypothetical protein
MKSAHTIILSAIIALCSFPLAAHAQPFLEFTVITSGQGASGNYNSMIRFVVDASDPDQTIIPSTLFATSSVQSNQSLSNESLPIQVFQFRVEDGSVFLHYNTTSGPFNGLAVNFSEGGPSQDPDESLPDDPAVYTGWTSGVANSTVDGFLYQINYDNSFSGSGIFNLSVREVPDPNPSTEPECIADLNDDGALNFLDISAYLQLYGDGCP